MKSLSSINNRPAKRLYTTKEAGVYLGRTVNAIRAMQWAGKLPHVKLDGRIYYDVLDLDALIERNKVVERE